MICVKITTIGEQDMARNVARKITRNMGLILLGTSPKSFLWV